LGILQHSGANSAGTFKASQNHSEKLWNHSAGEAGEMQGTGSVYVEERSALLFLAIKMNENKAQINFEEASCRRFHPG
jgi:hypothetical protein